MTPPDLKTDVLDKIIAHAKWKSSPSKEELSKDEILLIPAKLDYAEATCKCLAEAQRLLALYWNGKMPDIIGMMQNLVSGANGKELIPKGEFLRGGIGYAAVTHPAWKKSKDGGETIVTNLMLERHASLGWRVVLADLPTTRTLLHAKKLDFTTWSKDDIPPHIVANIRGSEDTDLN